MLRASAVCGSRIRSASGQIALRAASRQLCPAVRQLSVPSRGGRGNYSEDFGDHSWRQQNHIWEESEIAQRMTTANQKHVPQGLAENVLQKMVRVSYHGFNFFTGYEQADPATSAIGYRLIILESVAGVPGMLGGMFRHFRSLRHLERDHGFIFTLLEEAENERMHLIVCMSFFEAGPATRAAVQLAQVALTPFLCALYLVRPQLLHRFVGYLEETAVHTYTNIVNTAQTPGTKLHAAWEDVPAPEVAIKYWRMPAEASWVDCLKRMLADESHHRDVNHALASMPEGRLFGTDNPFVHEHQADYEAGVRRHTERLLKRALAENNINQNKTSTHEPLAPLADNHINQNKTSTHEPA